MPLYDYKCLSCDHDFSSLRRESEKDEKIACSACGQENAERQLSSFAVGAGSASPASSCANAATCGSSSQFG